MEADRGTRSLATVLRLGVAVVVFAAYVVDIWLSSTFFEARIQTALLAIGIVMACGWVWALWPQSTPYVALLAAFTSFTLTMNVQDRLRFPFFTEFAVFTTMFGAALWSRAAWRWPVAVIVFIVGETVSLRFHDPGIRNVLALTMFVLFAAVATVAVYVRMKDEERKVSVELARRNERLELARELHDIVGHHVTGIVVLAQASRFAAASTGGHGPGDTDRTLAEIERAGLETLTSVRRLVGLLRDDSPITSGPQLADVQQVVDDLRATHRQATLEVDAAIRAAWVPADLATTVHRLVQEAATNVRKHGDPDAPVTVALRRRAGSIAIEVQNRRLSGAAGVGYGLVGMRERVQALGGSFAAGPAGPDVWIVHAVLPLGAAG